MPVELTGQVDAKATVMQVALDVVDLLQLQEIWSRYPIITAFTRLEVRTPAILSPVRFNIEELMPRLARLKQSSAWQVKNALSHRDPARTPLAEFSEAHLIEMYPEAPSPTEQRQSLFNAVYNRYIVAYYRGSVEQTSTALRTLARVRAMIRDEQLGADGLPLQGSQEWIPFNITDEIRSLDKRYDPAEPGAPATYVVADSFWPLLVKVTSSDFEETIRVQCGSGEPDCASRVRRTLQVLSEVAHLWNRSPSVVGLCYQISD
jgi:hypothetical protein